MFSFQESFLFTLWTALCAVYEESALHRLLAAAGVLMLLAGGIFALMRKWRYAGLLGAGALGCIAGAINRKG